MNAKATKAIAAAAIALAVTSSFAGGRPARVMSGYTGYFLGGGSREHVEKMIDLMGENGFNAIDVKVHSSPAKGRFIANCMPEVKALVDRAKSRGLAFNVYLYPTYRGRNAKLPAHASLPVPVDGGGRRIEGSFLLTEPESWRVVFAEALGFAAHRRELGFATLRFDIEILSVHMSYDDVNWRLFCRSTRGFADNTPAAERFDLLEARKAKSAYHSFFYGRVRAAFKSFVSDIRALAPDIELGYMPARADGGICAIMNEELAADGAPAWMDGWDLYNGGGYQPRVKARCEKIRSYNRNNRYVTWICPNRYDPKDVASSVYHAAANTDGYSIWVMTMLDDARKNSLPKGATHAEYWAAFKAANEALRADMAAGTLDHPTRIAPVKVKPRVAELSWDGIVAPRLEPDGDGTGKAKSAMMRMTQNMFVWAKVGDPMKITIRHLAGQQRPTGLQYVLLSPSGKMMRNEAVTAGSHHAFTVVAEESGVHIFRATSGNIGGGPWYSVSVDAPCHWAIDARGSAYMFRKQTFYVDGADRGNPKIRIACASAESYMLSINGEAHEVVRQKRAEFDLPPGLVKITISTSKAGHGENFWTSFPGGKSPFIYPDRERRLKPAKEVAK